MRVTSDPRSSASSLRVVARTAICSMRCAMNHAAPAMKSSTIANAPRSSASAGIFRAGSPGNAGILPAGSSDRYASSPAGGTPALPGSVMDLTISIAFGIFCYPAALPVGFKEALKPSLGSGWASSHAAVSSKAPLLFDVSDEAGPAGFEPLRQKIDADLVERVDNREAGGLCDALDRFFQQRHHFRRSRQTPRQLLVAIHREDARGSEREEHGGVPVRRTIPARRHDEIRRADLGRKRGDVAVGGKAD